MGNIDGNCTIATGDISAAQWMPNVKTVRCSNVIDDSKTTSATHAMLLSILYTHTIFSQKMNAKIKSLRSLCIYNSWLKCQKLSMDLMPIQGYVYKLCTYDHDHIEDRLDLSTRQK